MEQSHNEMPKGGNNVPFDINAIDFDAVRDEVLEKIRTGEIEAAPKPTGEGYTFDREVADKRLAQQERVERHAQGQKAANDHGEEKKAA